MCERVSARNSSWTRCSVWPHSRAPSEFRFIQTLQIAVVISRSVQRETPYGRARVRPLAQRQHFQVGQNLPCPIGAASPFKAGRLCRPNWPSPVLVGALRASGSAERLRRRLVGTSKLHSRGQSLHLNRTAFQRALFVACKPSRHQSCSHISLLALSQTDDDDGSTC